MTTTRFRRAALLGGLVWIALSCGDPFPLGVEPPARAPVDAELLGALGSAVGLLQCSPLPYDSVTQLVGSDGGTLLVGAHTLSVPPGALGAPVSITAVAPSDTVNQVRFQPEGLVFTEPAALTMSYANCDLLGLPLANRIAWTSDALEILEYLHSVPDPASQTVTGRLEHFSTYAVAW